MILAAMKTILTIDDDVAAILERQSRVENKPFNRVFNEALRRGTSSSTGADEGAVAKPKELDVGSESIISGGTQGQIRRQHPHGLPKFKVKPHKSKWLAGDDPARLKENLEQADTERFLGKDG